MCKDTSGKIGHAYQRKDTAETCPNRTSRRSRPTPDHHRDPTPCARPWFGAGRRGTSPPAHRLASTWSYSTPGSPPSWRRRARFRKGTSRPTTRRRRPPGVTGLRGRERRRYRPGSHRRLRDLPPGPLGDRPGGGAPTGEPGRRRRSAPSAPSPPAPRSTTASVPISFKIATSRNRSRCRRTRTTPPSSLQGPEKAATAERREAHEYPENAKPKREAIAQGRGLTNRQFADLAPPGNRPPNIQKVETVRRQTGKSREGPAPTRNDIREIDGGLDRGRPPPPHGPSSTTPKSSNNRQRRPGRTPADGVPILKRESRALRVRPSARFTGPRPYRDQQKNHHRQPDTCRSKAGRAVAYASSWGTGASELRAPLQARRGRGRPRVQQQHARQLGADLDIPAGRSAIARPARAPGELPRQLQPTPQAPGVDHGERRGGRPHRPAPPGLPGPGHRCRLGGRSPPGTRGLGGGEPPQLRRHPPQADLRSQDASREYIEKAAGRTGQPDRPIRTRATGTRTRPGTPPPRSPTRYRPKSRNAATRSTGFRPSTPHRPNIGNRDGPAHLNARCKEDPETGAQDPTCSRYFSTVHANIDYKRQESAILEPFEQLPIPDSGDARFTATDRHRQPQAFTLGSQKDNQTTRRGRVAARFRAVRRSPAFGGDEGQGSRPEATGEPGRINAALLLPGKALTFTVEGEWHRPRGKDRRTGEAAAGGLQVFARRTEPTGVPGPDGGEGNPQDQPREVPARAEGKVRDAKDDDKKEVEGLPLQTTSPTSRTSASRTPSPFRAGTRTSATTSEAPAPAPSARRSTNLQGYRRHAPATSTAGSGATAAPASSASRRTPASRSANPLEVPDLRRGLLLQLHGPLPNRDGAHNARRGRKPSGARHHLLSSRLGYRHGPWAPEAEPLQLRPEVTEHRQRPQRHGLPGPSAFRTI